jgi:siroheme synthase-like protein
MKNNHRYPVFLDLRNAACLVVGGGAVANRKVAALRKAGARVFVVSPALCAPLKNCVSRGVIEWTKGTYASGQLRGMRLVIAATNDAAVNHRVFTDAERRNIPVNVVDDLDYCRFIVPARFTDGSLEVAVTTGGAAPKISAIVRNDIAREIGSKYGSLIAALGSRRGRIKSLRTDAKEAFWKTMIALAAKGGSSGDAAARKVDKALAAAQGGAR